MQGLYGNGNTEFQDFSRTFHFQLKYSISSQFCIIQCEKLHMYLAIFRVFCDFHTGFFAHPINLKGLFVLYIFQRLIHTFKDDLTEFKDKRHFFQIPEVFQDQGQIQGLFQVCANPDM